MNDTNAVNDKLFKVMKDEVINTSSLLFNNPKGYQKVAEYIIEIIDKKQNTLEFLSCDNLGKFSTEHDHKEIKEIVDFLMDRINCAIIECSISYGEFSDYCFYIGEQNELFKDFFKSNQITPEFKNVSEQFRKRPWLLYIYFVNLFKLEIKNKYNGSLLYNLKKPYNKTSNVKGFIFD